MAARPQASEGELTTDKTEMVRNMTLYRRGTLLGLPAVCLQRPFDKEKQLPELRKRLLSKKEIADLVEAILGSGRPPPAALSASPSASHSPTAR